MRAILRDSTR